MKHQHSPLMLSLTTSWLLACGGAAVPGQSTPDEDAAAGSPAVTQPMAATTTPLSYHLDMFGGWPDTRPDGIQDLITLNPATGVLKAYRDGNTSAGASDQLTIRVNPRKAVILRDPGHVNTDSIVFLYDDWAVHVYFATGDGTNGGIQPGLKKQGWAIGLGWKDASAHVLSCVETGGSVVGYQCIPHLAVRYADRLKVWDPWEWMSGTVPPNTGISVAGATLESVAVGSGTACHGTTGSCPAVKYLDMTFKTVTVSYGKKTTHRDVRRVGNSKDLATDSPNLRVTVMPSPPDEVVYQCVTPPTVVGIDTGAWNIGAGFREPREPVYAAFYDQFGCQYGYYPFAQPFKTTRADFDDDGFDDLVTKWEQFRGPVMLYTWRGSSPMYFGNFVTDLYADFNGKPGKEAVFLDAGDWFSYPSGGVWASVTMYEMRTGATQIVGLPSYYFWYLGDTISRRVEAKPQYMDGFFNGSYYVARVHYNAPRVDRSNTSGNKYDPMGIIEIDFVRGTSYWIQ